MKAQNVSLEGKTILVTGGAGFIGARLSQLLLGGSIRYGWWFWMS